MKSLRNPSPLSRRGGSGEGARPYARAAISRLPERGDAIICCGSQTSTAPACRPSANRSAYWTCGVKGSAAETVRGGPQPAKRRTGRPLTPTLARKRDPASGVLAGVDVLLGSGDEQLVEVLAAEGAGGHLARGHRKLFL